MSHCLFTVTHQAMATSVFEEWRGGEVLIMMQNLRMWESDDSNTNLERLLTSERLLTLPDAHDFVHESGGFAVTMADHRRHGIYNR